MAADEHPLTEQDLVTLLEFIATVASIERQLIEAQMALQCFSHN